MSKIETMDDGGKVVGEPSSWWELAQTVRELTTALQAVEAENEELRAKLAAVTPEWGSGEWRAMDSNGRWYEYADRPRALESAWIGTMMGIPRFPNWRETKERRPQ